MIYMIVYNAVIYALIAVCSPIIAIAVLLNKNFRRELKTRLGETTGELSRERADRRVIWFHAASVGEVQALKPVVKEMKRMLGNKYIFIATATTANGKKKMLEEMPKELSAAFLFPLDVYPIPQIFIRKINPYAVVIVETEFWPNFINSAAALQVPIILINGRISNKSFRFYLLFGFLFRQVLSKFTFFIMQSEKMILRLRAIGIGKEKMMAMNNTKYSAGAGRQNKSGIKLKNKKRKVVVFGSIRNGEEMLAIDAYKRLNRQDTCFMIAPRHMARVAKIQSLLRKNNLSYLLWKSIKNYNAINKTDIIIINTIGELNDIYGIGDVAVIGGGFKKFGGHNPMEAASAGLPIIMGRNMSNFEDTADKFVKAGGAFQVDADSWALAEKISLLLNDERLRTVAGKTNKKVVEKFKGSALSTAKLVNRILTTREILSSKKEGI